MNLKNDLVSILGDLQIEKRRLSESFRKLEGEISLQNTKTKSSTIESGFTEIGRALDRVSILTKSLFNRVSLDGLVSVESFLSEVIHDLIQFANVKDRRVKMTVDHNGVMIDRETLKVFSPIFKEIMKTFIEFSIEPQRERLIRKKPSEAQMKFEIRSLADSYCLKVSVDGSGVYPPFYDDHGKSLSKIGLRGVFEGVSAISSTWIFEIPISFIFFRALGFKCSGRRLFVPAYALHGLEKLTDHQAHWGISKELERFKISPKQAGQFGKWILDIASGTQVASYAVEEVFGLHDLILKPLHPTLNGDGRFLGVHVHDVDDEELGLIINPSYFVYGSQINAQKGDANADKSIA